ncbi:hypothetical protein [Eubacterium sp. CAG:161]|uniref:hypothetical protein n=1 Tax=Eubacterium sp. CAG:161 TaxID=1262881 RepID=UPI00033CA10E|nr:hypothetical protein [Eubacterium sp. CAG:161]CCY70013.1 fibronectin type III domain [Eubacterium sp. CAG:161]
MKKEIFKKNLKVVLALLLTIAILTNSVELINAEESNLATSQPENTDTYVENVEPVKPVITLKRKNKKVTVTIKNWQENTRYQVYVKKRGKYKQIKTIKKNKYSFKFDKRKLCRVKVRAAKKVNGKTVFSDFAKKTLDYGLTNADNWSDAYKVMHKYLKNNNQYMGRKGIRCFYLLELKGECFIKVRDYDEPGIGNGNLYRLEYIRKTVNHNTKVHRSYNVKFEMRCDYEVFALYGKMLIMKNGKMILKIKSGKLINKKLKIRKRYRIVLKELDENSKLFY